MCDRGHRPRVVGLLIAGQVGTFTCDATGDLEISLYPAPTGRPRLGGNQLDVKRRDPQGWPVSEAEVKVAASMDGRGHGNRMATRPGGYGIFSTVLRFPMPGKWNAEVIVRRPGPPHVNVSFRLSVE